MTPEQFKKKYAPKVSTNDLTTQVVNHLNMLGFLAWRQNNAAIFDPTKKTFRSNSSKKGVADILAVEPQTGRFWAIEIKTGKDKQSDEQKLFQFDVVKRKGVYLVVRCFDDILEGLKNNCI